MTDSGIVLGSEVLVNREATAKNATDAQPSSG